MEHEKQEEEQEMAEYKRRSMEINFIFEHIFQPLAQYEGQNQDNSVALR